MAGKRRPHRVRRIIVRVVVVIVLIVILLFATILGILFVPTHFPATAPITHPVAAVKHDYLALGDSLAFGFQPNLNWDQGYAMQWWSELQRRGSRSFYDYSCSGATSKEFIQGGCPFSKLQHDYYAGSQLQAAISFIKGHPGQVGPVSLDIGGDDVLPYINTQTCSVAQHKFSTALAQLEKRLTTTILPQLKQALKSAGGKAPGQLVMMNYYDPFAKKCSIAHHYIHLLNAHLARAAARAHVPLVDVYAAYHQNIHSDADICKYTWMCSIFHSLHPNTTGYGVIMHAFERRVGY